MWGKWTNGEIDNALVEARNAAIMKALSCLLRRSIVLASFAFLCWSHSLFAQEKFTVDTTDKDLFAKAGDNYDVRVRIKGKEEDPTEYTLKIKVWKVTGEITGMPPKLPVADAMGDVEIRAKTGDALITEIKVKKGQENFRIKPLSAVEGQNLIIQIYNNDDNEPLGYMVLAVKSAAKEAEKDIKTVSTPIGVGRH